MKEHYSTLGLDDGASMKDVKKAYRKKAFKLHPDVNTAPNAHEAFIKVKNAYDSIVDQNKASKKKSGSKSSSTRKSTHSQKTSGSSRGSTNSSTGNGSRRTSGSYTGGNSSTGNGSRRTSGSYTDGNRSTGNGHGRTSGYGGDFNFSFDEDFNFTGGFTKKKTIDDYVDDVHRNLGKGYIDQASFKYRQIKEKFKEDPKQKGILEKLCNEILMKYSDLVEEDINGDFISNAEMHYKSAEEFCESYNNLIIRNMYEKIMNKHFSDVESLNMFSGKKMAFDRAIRFAKGKVHDGSKQILKMREFILSYLSHELNKELSNSSSYSVRCAYSNIESFAKDNLSSESVEVLDNSRKQVMDHFIQKFDQAYSSGDRFAATSISSEADFFVQECNYVQGYVTVNQMKSSLGRL